jgi:hypothetical protein
VKCFALTGAKIIPPRDNSEGYSSLERPAVRSFGGGNGHTVCLQLAFLSFCASRVTAPPGKGEAGCIFDEIQNLVEPDERLVMDVTRALRGWPWRATPGLSAAGNA